MLSNEEKQIRSKNFIRVSFIVLLVLTQGILFYNTWINSYNITLRNPYILKGNIFLMIIYMSLLYVFMLIFDCNNISYSRTTNIVLSETLASFSTNILVYLVMIIPAAASGLQPFMPIISLFCVEFIIIFFSCIFIHYIFLKFFSKSDVLLVTSINSVDKEVLRFSKRNDIYNIKETISFDNNLPYIYSRCDCYKNIIVGDISSETRNDIIKYCFSNSHNIYIIPKISDILLKYSDDIFIFDTPIYLSTNFGLTFENALFKRLFDIIFSLIVIILFSPIYIIIAILIKLEDGGNVIFMQKRVTQYGKIFNIYKFRSMYVNNSKNVLPTTNNDARITKIGNIIRKLHFDELPQFFNVLIGDMSVVGPRPERIEHNELYSKQISEFKFRLKVKAGITGLAQIYGKYNTTAIDKLKLDLIYIKKYSIVFDIELVLRTIKVFFMKDNTEGFDEKTQHYINKNAK